MDPSATDTTTLTDDDILSVQDEETAPTGDDADGDDTDTSDGDSDGGDADSDDTDADDA